VATVGRSQCGDSKFWPVLGSPLPLCQDPSQDDSLGFQSSSPSHILQIHIIGRACGLPWASPGCWKGSISGDSRSFARVVLQCRASVVMVPPRRPRSLGRSGFGSGRVGQGVGRMGRQGRAWHSQEWNQCQDGEDGLVDTVKVATGRPDDPPFYQRCRSVGHLMKDCRQGWGAKRVDRYLYDQGGENDRKLSEMIAALCAIQVDGQAFFCIPDRPSQINARERVNTVIVTMLEGVVTIKQIEDEFSRILSRPWRRTARKVTSSLSDSLMHS
jgi:hypothetical protein